MSKTVKNTILASIKDEEINHVFIVPGSTIDEFYESIKEEDLVAIVASCETGAAYMADGYGRAAKKFGVCMSIGGPGVANVVPGLAAASEDKAAILVVSGEVPSTLIGKGAFQDGSQAGMNDIEMVRPVAKLCLSLDFAENTDLFLRKTMRAMLVGNSGPAYLKVPVSVQNKPATKGKTYKPVPSSVYCPRVVEVDTANAALEAISHYKKIAILAGTGVVQSDAEQELLRFSHSFKIPVASTLKSKGVFPENDPFALGVFGYAGSKRSIDTILSGDLDVLIVLGSSLSQRDTLFWSKKLQPKHLLVHIDINSESIGKNYHADIEVVADAKSLLNYWLLRSPGEITDRLRNTNKQRLTWVEKTQKINMTYDVDKTKFDTTQVLAPDTIAPILRECVDQLKIEEPAIVVDSGAHRVWSSHYWESRKPNRFFTAASLAPMGWAIAAGLGVQLALDTTTIVFTGDGCMQMEGREISTAVRYNVPVIWIVYNNNLLGNVNLRAKKMGEYADELTQTAGINWADFAKSLQCQASKVSTKEQLVRAFKKAVKSKAPYLIDVACINLPTPVSPYAKEKEIYLSE